MKRNSILKTRVFGARALSVKQTAAAAFCAQTFPHVRTLYSGAFCLTQCPDQAADLVVAAYLRAFQDYGHFRNQPVPVSYQARATCDWLFTNLYATFCAGIFMHASQTDTPTGDQPC